MSVPTHNLYDFVHQATKRHFFLMFFQVWGSRELADVCYYQRNDAWLTSSNGIAESDRYDLRLLPKSVTNCLSVIQTQPVIFCHDQEPLNYNLYLDSGDQVQNFHSKISRYTNRPFRTCLTNLNLRWANHDSIQKTWILLHSELNSTELAQYESTGQYAGAYWWSHAIIARDWYRYAEHDSTLNDNNKYQQLFLTYCRDTTGSRSYRRDFLNQLNARSIMDHCRTSSPDAGPESSAVYDVNDFNQTAISIVLETLFDDRVHLTEKILRPIACGHPFILAAGPGSLGILKSYGFKTFSPYINESYDHESDHSIRLQMITAEMDRVAKLSARDRNSLIIQCKKIAEFNKQHFFSKEFFNQVVQELQDNVVRAYYKTQGQLDYSNWWKERQWRRKKFPEALQLPLPDNNFKPYLALAYRKQRNVR